MDKWAWIVVALMLGVSAGGRTNKRSAVPEQILPTAGACLHDAMEQPADRLRRDRALATMRAIHEAQARAVQQSHQYQPIAALQPLAIPEAFRVEWYASAFGYLVVLKDGRDPCGFAMFSDQSGVVYQASAQTMSMQR